MILWIVKFPKKYRPGEIAFKTFAQADEVRKHFKLSTRKLRLLYVQEDENKMPFFQDNVAPAPVRPNVWVKI